ncbi:toll-like receptor 13 [Spea bombifrons]|uniref:toll-like receptor 13 n=1 Tax=Spea bombifrons TaxID=233779 RepID=UPI00234936B4|nr:toll-like receptor 13 [Spea bombifrons]XP_053320190.1 toll-like receptor 13 [Spea bombifrons]XP_053320191.1 toll-like receptor 13 [Spea bombifrons]XP_053320192.1 toll-like receptor 13 [Spea bombifrons]
MTLCPKTMLSLLGLILVLLASFKKGDSYAIQGCEVHRHYHPKVLCYKQGLSSVPAQLPNITFSLDISFNKINRINIKDFHNLTLLQEMNISSNQISFIDNGAFQNLQSLRMLNFSSNRLESLKSHMFSGLKNLTTLLLDNNNITTIESSAFSGLQNLEILSLSSNPLYTLDAMHAAFRIGGLKEIHIANVSLQHFSTNDLINISTTLHTIDVSNNPISTVSIVTSALQNLTYMDMSFTRQQLFWKLPVPCFLKELKRLNMEGMHLTPATVSGIIQSLSCSSLEEINVGYLNLTDFDHIIQQICLNNPNMKILRLQGNSYTEFSKDTFKNCTVLKYLDLSYNMFQRVQSLTFQHLGSLQHLSLAYNRLTSMPADLSYMTSLKTMNLSYNHVSEVFFNDTKAYNNLKSLDLSGNKMSVFNSSLAGNWSLLELNLGNNYLLDISHSFQASLKHLQTLWLRKNKLSSLSSDTFKNLVSLKSLNLIDNQIENIEPGAFNGLEKLQILLLGSNKLTQDVLNSYTFQGLNSLLELQLFGNFFNYQSSSKLNSPPFLSLSSLKLLTLNSQAHNGMQNIPSNFFKGLVSLEKVHTGNLALKSIDHAIFNYTPQLEYIDLSNNHFQHLDPRLLQPVRNITELHISQNNLESLDFLVESNNTKLILIRAVGNQLTTLSDKQFNALPDLGFLDLRNNTFSCSCDNQWFIQWVQTNPKTQVLHFYEYACAYPPTSKGKMLFAFNTDLCRQHYDYILFLSTCLLISIFLVISTVWKLWRWKVLYSYYVFLGFLYNRKTQDKRKYEYDAFISYNSHDEEWVFNHLVPNLEESYSRKLCLHHRDFEPGKHIIDNIIDSIYNSRKTICVITRHYLESEWCSKEIQVASYRLFHDHADVLVLLFLEDIPSYKLSPYHQIRKIIKKKTYLVWPKNINARPLFWHMVNQALKNEHTKEDEDRSLLGLCK